MSMRISSLAALSLLAACAPAAEEPAGEAIACALDGAVEFSDVCALDRTTVDGKQVLVVRHPDGGFRRLEVSADGQTLEAADGADVTQSALKGDRWEVILGANRYVIPAKADAPRE